MLEGGTYFRRIKEKIMKIGDTRVQARIENYSRWSGPALLRKCDLSKGFKEVRELAMWMSGGRAFWAERTASAKTVR